jgi:hypothetical protein
MTLAALKRPLSALLLLSSLWYIFAFLGVAISSINYPFQLEWMEGQTIDIIARIHDGKPFYVEPHLEYVPFIYTPLYYYVAALIAHVTVLDFFPARLLSILSTLGTSALIFAWLRSERGSVVDGVIGMGMFFSTYLLSGRWFDVSRIDNFWMFLLLSGLFMLYHYRGMASAAAAAILLVAAFFTKQSAIIAFAPALAASVIFDWKRGVLCGVLAAAGILFGIEIFQLATDGWFGFYVFTVPAGHGLEKAAIAGFWTNDLAGAVGIYYLLALGAIAWMGKENLKRSWWYVAFLLGFVMASYISRLHWGGWLNVLIPLHVAVSLLAGLSLKYWRWHKPQVALAAGSFTLLQMALLFYNPQPLIPTQESVEKGRRFLDEIALIDGDIFMSEIQFVQTRAGKKSFTYGMAGFDVMRSDLKDKNHIRDKLYSELLDAFENHRFSAVISGRLLRLREKDGYYTFDRNLDYPKEYITGAIPRSLTGLYIPKTE